MILLLFSQKGTRLEKIESNLHLQVRPGLSSTCLGCIYIFFPIFIFPSCSALVISLEIANMSVIDVAR